ncbi:hypothetical protein IV203_019049 [Nitzschia inconspicua]|uniref:Uncharacterized protein n=1 Tax=Nitzschia inconspicua TaxID=303405 RepID=A0A9K3LYF9_9STRA|nr:hypothetical protein IV203_019049 [Nitzschia inconspicua]
MVTDDLDLRDCFVHLPDQQEVPFLMDYRTIANEQLRDAALIADSKSQPLKVQNRLLAPDTQVYCHAAVTGVRSIIMMRFNSYSSLLALIILPMGMSLEYVFEGVATVALDKYKYEGFSSTPVFVESVNRQYGTTIVVTDPRSDPDTSIRETNPFSITIHSDIFSQEGSFSIASALFLRTPTDRIYLAQYWTFESYTDGTLEGTLTNNHLAEAAAYNLVDVTKEIYPGYSMPFPNAMANGAKISGTLTVEQAQLTILGNTEDQLTFFVITLDAYSQNDHTPSQGTSEDTTFQDDLPSQEISTQVNDPSQDTMHGDSTNEDNPIQSDILIPSSHSSPHKSILQQSLVNLFALHSLWCKRASSKYGGIIMGRSGRSKGAAETATEIAEETITEYTTNISPIEYTTTEDAAVVAPIESISPAGFVAVKKGRGIENCIFLSWDDAKSFLLVVEGEDETEAETVTEPIEYKIVRTLQDAKRFLVPEAEIEQEGQNDNSKQAAAANSSSSPSGSPNPSGAYHMAPGYPYMYYPSHGSSSASKYPATSSTAHSMPGSSKDSQKRKVPGPEETKMAAYQGYPYYGYPYYPAYGGNPYMAATSATSHSSNSSTTKRPSNNYNNNNNTSGSATKEPANKRSRSSESYPMPPINRNRPPLPPMAYNGWNSPQYMILVEYYHMVGTTKLLFRPTLEAVCKMHSGNDSKNVITREDIMEWMKVQRIDYHTMTKEQRDRTATFDLLSKLDFPFGSADNYSLDTTKIMVASKVQRRKAPFLGILSEAPTKMELEEGVAAQRQGPIWDCMYLAMSDYVKIAGTLQVIEPTYMTVILRQFAKDGDESILTLDHLLTWMNAQRTSYRDTTVMTNAREIAKATSKLSCLQTVGFDWDYEPRVVDSVLAAAAAKADKDEAEVAADVKKEISNFIFDDGDNFLVRTDQGAYYKAMKEIPNDPNAKGGLALARSSHLPDHVEKAILRTMLPPQNQLQFSHICNLNLELFGYPEDKLRKACTNRRKYLEKVEQNNPEAFQRLLKAQGLPDGNDYDLGGDIPNKEIELLVKATKIRKEPNKDLIEKGILRSMLPPQNQIPFSEVASRKDYLFGPPNGRIVRAAKLRRKELDELQTSQPTKFQDLLTKFGLDKLTAAENELDADAAEIAAYTGDGGDEGDDNDDDGSALFWNKPGSKVMADKDTQKKYRMQRNPLPLETDKLLCKHVLGGDHRFALLCNSRPSLFGLPNSRERRKIDDRRRLLREMMQKRPHQFVEVCRAHGLESELKQQGLVREDGSLNEEAAAALLSSGMDPSKVGHPSGAAADEYEEEENDDNDDDEMETEDKSPTKAAAISLQALRRKGVKITKAS